MARRCVTLPLLVAALGAALPARAQFQPHFMKVPGWIQADLATGNWSGAAGDDLMVLSPGALAAARFDYRDLLTELGLPYTPPAAAQTSATAWFDGVRAGSPPDVAWGYRTGIYVSWGESPLAAPSGPWPVFTEWVDAMSAVRLLPRAQPVVAAASLDGVTGHLYAVDLIGSRPATAPASRAWSVPGTFLPAEDGGAPYRIFPLRLSPGAVAGGVDDAVVLLSQGLFLLWHDAAPADATLAGLSMTAAVFGASGTLGLTNGGFLPTGAQAEASCLGAAAVDVDGDGDRDLVFSYASEIFAYRGIPGWLLWIENVGTPASPGSIADMLANQKPWKATLVGRADLLPITDTGVLRQLDLGTGEPVFAVHDRASEQIVVVRGDGATGFRTLALPVPGARVRDMIAADVVGSPAKDLVVLVDLEPDLGTTEVWVYPDDGDLSPVLSWTDRPASAPLGVELALGVAVDDADAPVRPYGVSWRTPGPPETEVATGSTWLVPAAALCGPATTLDVEVRALDDWGVYTELQASIPLEARPVLRLAGSAAEGPLVLVPGGVALRAEGEAWPACATASLSYAWRETALSGAVVTSEQPAGSATAWRELTLPESAYPEALGGHPALTLDAADGPFAGSATLDLSLDARGLVAVAVAFDEAALSAGEVGTARVRLESRIGVALPAVRAAVRLAGLAFAGPIAVEGAAATLGPGEGRAVVDLPPAGTAVVLRVPVRSLGAPGAVSVELFSSADWRLSPEASPRAGGATLPGCGCGAWGADPAGLLGLVAAAVALRRRRPT